MRDHLCDMGILLSLMEEWAHLNHMDMTILKTTTNDCNNSKHGNSLEPRHQIIEEDGLVGFISQEHDNKPNED